MHEGIEHEIGPRIRPLQVIVMAMVLGAVMFLIVGAIIGRDVATTYQATSRTPILTYLCTGFAVVALIARALVPGAMTVATRSRIVKAREDARAIETTRPPSTAPPPTDEINRLYGAYAAMVVVGAACTEGAALLAGLAFLIERESWSALVGVVMILALAAQTPTHTGMGRWLREQLRYLDQLPPPA